MMINVLDMPVVGVIFSFIIIIILGYFVIKMFDIAKRLKDDVINSAMDLIEYAIVTLPLILIIISLITFSSFDLINSLFMVIYALIVMGFVRLIIKEFVEVSSWI